MTFCYSRSDRGHTTNNVACCPPYPSIRRARTQMRTLCIRFAFDKIDTDFAFDGRSSSAVHVSIAGPTPERTLCSSSVLLLMLESKDHTASPLACFASTRADFVRNFIAFPSSGSSIYRHNFSPFVLTG